MEENSITEEIIKKLRALANNWLLKLKTEEY